MGLSVFQSRCHLPTCLPHTVKALRCPYILLKVEQESCEYQFFFFGFRFYSAGNRTRVYRFIDALSTLPLIGFNLRRSEYRGFFKIGVL